MISLQEFAPSVQILAQGPGGGMQGPHPGEELLCLLQVCASDCQLRMTAPTAVTDGSRAIPVQAKFIAYQPQQEAW